MPDNLDIFGKTFTNAMGIKATDTGGVVRKFTRASGSVTISENGTHDVAAYETAVVNAFDPNTNYVHSSS